MATTKRKRRGKIPYIGEPLTASEIAARHPLPRKYQEYLDRTMPVFLEKMRQQDERRKRRSSPKTARAK
jgi:hypothetical protein